MTISDKIFKSIFWIAITSSQILFNLISDSRCEAVMNFEEVIMKFKRTISIFCVIALCLSMSTVAFATEDTVNGKQADFGQCIYEDSNIVVMLGNPENPSAPLSDSAEAFAARTVDYNYVWLDGGYASGEFYVATSNSSPMGITLKIQSEDPNAFAFCTVLGPNGEPLKGHNNVWLTPGMNNDDGYVGTIYNSPSGTYTIDYIAQGQAGMRIMCWIY